MNRFLTKSATPVLGLPRFAKRSIVLLLDFSLCILTTWFAYYLRLGEFISLSDTEYYFSKGLVLASMVSACITLPIFLLSGLYRAIFRYSGWPAVMTIARAVGFYSLLYVLIFTVIGFSGVPRTVGIIQPMLLFLMVGGSRLFARVWLGDQYRSILKRSDRPKALIYGAGNSGRQLSDVLSNSYEMEIVGFLDDDPRLQGQVINGNTIYNPNELNALVPSLRISIVLLAMPSITRKRRNEILTQIQAFNISVRTLPSMMDLVQGRITTTDLRELDIDDLLGRDSVVPDENLIRKNITNQVVLVTGAGGSIGSELCRQILAMRPKTLLLVEQSEAALYLIHEELEKKCIDREITLVPLLASVQHVARIEEIFSLWRPYIVYHAAAYKHVPIVEHNLMEGLQNNVFGTLCVAQSAIGHRVQHFVLISTDKAVRPTNMMGATKRLSEMILQALAAKNSGTTFSMVRFGNVLGSSGSVVPKFRQQIRDGGPITLTHPDITRYFMTIPEAAQLVIQAGAMAEGGEIFVLDMGESVKIIDLAKRMVKLSGLVLIDEDHPEGDIEIQITGLRPGEKLYEELLIGDNPQATSNPRIMKAQEEYLHWDLLEKSLTDLQHLIELRDTKALIPIMKSLVQQYAPTHDVVDWVYLESNGIKYDRMNIL